MIYLPAKWVRYGEPADPKKDMRTWYLEVDGVAIVAKVHPFPSGSARPDCCGRDEDMPDEKSVAAAKRAVEKALKARKR